MRHLKIAIVGRPNVGKSTLFNRLVGRKLALVDDRPGVTRDRREGEATIGDLDLLVIDTAGFEEATDDSLEARMRRQTEMAITEADISLFVIDARAGVTPLDRAFASLLRKSGSPVLVVANKAEGNAAEAGIYEAYEFGLGDPIPMSAEHNEGIPDLYRALIDFAGAREAEAEIAEAEDADERPAGPLRIAVIGQPNAGKSTLINRIVGADRLLTGPEAGITRDSITLEWSWHGRELRLIDTAGMRRKARVQDKLERLSVADTLNSIRFAEVVILLMDATMPFEKQDLQLADLIAREGRALVIGLSKWDLVDDPSQAMQALRERAERLLPQVSGVQLIPVSGLTGRGLDKLMKAVFEADDIWNTRVRTAKLNDWFGEWVDQHAPPAVSGRRIKLRYITQSKARPPTFILFGNQLDALPDSYKRYIVNGLRQTFDLAGTPIRLYLRQGDNPYAKD
ncbi:MAG: ribosome biogenesis GTPase Der [Rhodobiaceae bacterium]|nr:ribosome biogenesis GTPase Der [Rhodobiaceae bacterium]MCC0056524.1 ribosome biogenesis GTPase Der [Rhodobiaceae bacterium]